jgi:phage shock protein PspC (stress-responsive transcriptional regulator)
MAEYLDIEPFLIRALWVVGTVVTVGGLIVVYIILGIVLPKGP